MRFLEMKCERFRRDKEAKARSYVLQPSWHNIDVKHWEWNIGIGAVPSRPRQNSKVKAGLAQIEECVARYLS